MSKNAYGDDRRDGHTRSLWKGMAAGLAGGLAASWVMNQFQKVWSEIAQDADKDPASESSGRANEGAKTDEQDDTTMKVASAISERIFGHKLTRDEKKRAGPAVHYAFGGAMGALYGAMAEFKPEARRGNGTAFSTLLWLAADETTLPLLGLSKSPLAYPFSAHAYGFASHVVYGLTSDCVRRLVRRSLG